MVWKCLVVDEDTEVQKSIEKYFLDIPSIELLGFCNDAQTAKELLLKMKIDILIVDKKISRLFGIDFILRLIYPPAVIITSADKQDTSKVVGLNVIDYLLKPFTFDRFYVSVNKVVDLLGVKESINMPILEPKEKASVAKSYIFVREEKITYKVNLNSILYIQTAGKFNKIYTNEKIYKTNRTIEKLQETLPADVFLRVNELFVIAKDKIESFTKSQVRIAGTNIPIEKTYQKPFLELVEG